MIKEQTMSTNHTPMVALPTGDSPVASAERVEMEYLSLIAHDLRAPHAITVGVIKLLLATKENSIRSEHRLMLEKLVLNAEKSLRLIDDILHQSRFKTGSIILNRQFLNSRIMAFSAMSQVDFLAESKGLAILNEMPENARLYGDPVLLEQVLFNLLTNAIKFSYPGGNIRIGHGVYGGASISISDNGTGIKPEMMKDLFRKDIKTSMPGTGGETGIGLALPMCYDILSLHGGNILVDSKPGEGSAFTIMLPSVKPMIVLVDEDEKHRFHIKMMLESLDVDIIETDTGEKALSVIEIQKPHLVISDLFMQGLDGFDLLSKIKGQSDLNSIQLIIITSAVDMATKEKAFLLGAEGCFEKPVTQEQLIPRLRKIIA